VPPVSFTVPSSAAPAANLPPRHAFEAASAGPPVGFVSAPHIHSGHEPPTREKWKSVADWRLAAAMPGRAAPVRDRLKRGLAAEGIEVADGKMRSRDFGVVTGNALPAGEAAGD